MAGVASGMRLTPARLNQPVVRARQITLQTITNNTWTSITFTAEDIDTHGMHSTATNTSRFTVPSGYAGIYELSGGVSWAGGTTGQRWTRWALNGTEIDGSGTSIDATSGGQALTDAQTITVSLVAGDYIELQGLHSQGINLDTYVGVNYAQSQVSIRRVEIA